MKSLSIIVACLASTLYFINPSSELAAEPEADSPSSETKFDFTKPESPTLPTPKGMKWIDQGKWDPRLKGYRTPEGFRLEIVADAPTIINPVGMRFGPDGTLFVLEWTPDTNTWPESNEKLTYKDGSTRSVATMKKKVKDLVKVLTYNAATGTFDSAKVILEDELPSSILIHEGWLYTASRSTVRRWKLAEIIQGENKNAKPEIIAQGFCGFHHHPSFGFDDRQRWSALHHFGR